MLAVERPARIFSSRESGSIVRSMRSLGSELTKSINSRAGTVIAPSSSTMAPILVVMEISRLVADSRSIPPSVLSSTFCVTGKVAREATARPTTPKPRLRFSCKQEIFIALRTCPSVSVSPARPAVNPSSLCARHPQAPNYRNSGNIGNNYGLTQPRLQPPGQGGRRCGGGGKPRFSAIMPTDLRLWK